MEYGANAGSVFLYTSGPVLEKAHYQVAFIDGEDIGHDTHRQFAEDLIWNF